MSVTVNLDPQRATNEIKRKLGSSLVNIVEAIREQAQHNIQHNQQIDTGFMRQSNYGVVDYAGTRHSSYSETWQNGSYPRSKGAGGLAEREIAPEQRLSGEQAGAVVAGATYAADQELEQSFLWQAVEDLRQRGLGGLIDLL